ncbi:type II toxin-antitoxin system MqsA family antitoxin [Acetobacterium wieringae]|uniref:Type II toxin-antitoxin system MqsA family antitoxin n=1 Tax=Acetobacterium wieringae TaxID=52694 RepID=A0A5D0WNX8_9FIRM|nr:type II toxin-antitoxin system MqsA family antitoxin [Acetobacterium wieringae]TYC86045.1 type II toxin-antitoxin system MqsA family antitoxin [Acetobacterium wieringae]
MDCFLCKGKLTESTTTYRADLGNIIVIVKNVPCHKCIQCGEESFSGTVVAQLEHIIDQLRNTLTEIAVVNYDNRAA